MTRAAGRERRQLPVPRLGARPEAVQEQQRLAGARLDDVDVGLTSCGIQAICFPLRWSAFPDPSAVLRKLVERHLGEVARLLGEAERRSPMMLRWIWSVPP